MSTKIIAFSLIALGVVMRICSHSTFFHPENNPDYSGHNLFMPPVAGVAAIAGGVILLLVAPRPTPKPEDHPGG